MISTHGHNIRGCFRSAAVSSSSAALWTENTCRTPTSSSHETTGKVRTCAVNCYLKTILNSFQIHEAQTRTSESKLLHSFHLSWRIRERERDFALYIDEPSLVCSSVTLTGLLIEADPSYYTQILGKNRKAWSINACLSPINSVSVVSDPTTFVDQSRQLNLSVLHVYIYWRSPPPKAIKQD